MAASPPPDAQAAAIFTAAQAAWNARSVPPYESFELDCDQTFLADRCGHGTIVQFIVRSADGRSFAQTLDAQGKPGVVLLRGGNMFGPAGAPFGFYRRTPVPGAALAYTPPPAAPSDPIATIASVTAVDRAYDVTPAGAQSVDGVPCIRLKLRPLRDPSLYPLRELLVQRETNRIAALTYAQPYNGGYAIVHYRFAAVGPHAYWTIVHIDASAGREYVSEDLANITFPAVVPASDFTP